MDRHDVPGVAAPDQEGYCLVLSGGGAKGIYHVGVWKALREMGVPVGCIIGNSIGAVLAGLFAQGDDEESAEAASLFALKNVLNIPPELVHDGEFRITRETFPVFRAFYRSVIEQRGLDTAPFRALIERHVSEDAVRASTVDLGVVTYNLSDMEANEVFLEEMAPGTVVDYLLASSAFPGFARADIGGKKFIDGGVHDNIPYRMARRRGYRKIIVVDISGFGVKRKIDITGSRTVYIKNSIDMGGVLDFDAEFLKTFRHLGYLDTMRVFGRRVGYRYFLKPGERLAAELQSPPDQPDRSDTISAGLAAYARDRWGRSADTDRAAFRALAPEYCRYDRRMTLVCMECAAAAVGVERVADRSIEDLRSAIVEAREAIDASIRRQREDDEVGSWDRAVTWVRSFVTNEDAPDEESDQGKRTPYYYVRLAGEVLPGPSRTLALKALAEFYPDLPLGLFYLERHAGGESATGGSATG